jgi:hypothetical protein
MIISKLALLHPHTLFALQKAMPLNETWVDAVIVLCKFSESCSNILEDET